MAAKTKACPQCGTTMEFRLGTYECPQCGQEVEGEKQPEAPVADSSGPGFRKEAWHRSTTPSSGQVSSPTGTVYTPGVAPAAGLYGAQDAVATTSRFPTLETEKKAVFGIRAGCGAVEIVVILIAGIAAETGGAVVLNLLLNIVGYAIGLSILWYVLFEAQLWMKQACCALQGCSAGAWVFIAMFVTSPTVLSMANINPLDHHFMKLVIWGLMLPQILWNAWIMYILWRDVRQIHGN